MQLCQNFGISGGGSVEHPNPTPPTSVRHCISATNIEWLIPEAVLTQFVSPDDEHNVLETCRVISRNKYIEKNMCITLVIYQEYKLTLSIHCTIFKCQSLNWEVPLCQQFNHHTYNRCTSSRTYAFIFQLCPNKIIWYHRISTELWKITQVIYKIWRSHGGKDSHCGLLGCDTM